VLYEISIKTILLQIYHIYDIFVFMNITTYFYSIKNKRFKGGWALKLFFSTKAINKLQSLSQFENICLSDTNSLNISKDPDIDLVIRTNETDFSRYDEVLETHIGKVHVQTSALKILGHDNRVDFDDFRQVFVLIVDGQMVNDNIYLQKAQ